MRLQLDVKYLQPNPKRDFRLDPIDEEHVAILAQSIKDHDFWGGIVARRAKHGYELLAGEHRRQAALKAGITAADIFVGDFDDEQALLIYATENASQRSNISTAVLGSVGAAVRVCLEDEFLAVGSYSQKGGDHGRQGVGLPRILAKLKGVPGITTYVVQQQIATLKSSGEYDRIAREVGEEARAKKTAELAAIQAAQERAELEALRAAEAKERARKAEEARRKAAADAEKARKAAREAKEREERRRTAERAAEAERREREANKARLEAARKEEEARKEAEKAAERAAKERAREDAIKADRERIAAKQAKAELKAKERPAQFDMRVASVFKNPAHVEAFRALVMHKKVAQILRVDDQLNVARAILQEFKRLKAEAEGKLGQPEFTAAFIEKHFFEVAAAPMYLQHLEDKKERQAAKQAFNGAAWDIRWQSQTKAVWDKTRLLSSTVAEVVKLNKQAAERPEFNGHIKMSIDQLRSLVTELERLGVHRPDLEGRTVLDGELISP